MPRKRPTRGKSVRRKGPPLATYLKRRPRRTGVATVLILIVLFALILVDRNGWLLYPGDELSRYDGRMFRVVKVIDGDTIDVRRLDQPLAKPTRVRLWGVDCPETAKPWEGLVAQPFADQAMALTRQLCDGQSVRLGLQPHSIRGRYGRLLAYVELPDGTILNQRLLEAGLAGAEDRFVHREFDRYAMIEKQAQHDKVGVWSAPKRTDAAKH